MRSRLARRAVGADLSAPLVEVAARRARAESVDNVEFVVADAQTHTFGDGAFDLVIGQFGLMAGGPGMFAHEEADETTALLDAAGFAQIEIEPISPTILLGGVGTLEESIEFLLATGVVRGLLGRLEPEARAAAIGSVRSTLAERHEPGVGTRLGTGGWLVSALG